MQASSPSPLFIWPPSSCLKPHQLHWCLVPAPHSSLIHGGFLLCCVKIRMMRPRGAQRQRRQRPKAASTVFLDNLVGLHGYAQKVGFGCWLDGTGVLHLGSCDWVPCDRVSCVLVSWVSELFPGCTAQVLQQQTASNMTKLRASSHHCQDMTRSVFRSIPRNAALLDSLSVEDTENA